MTIDRARKLALMLGLTAMVAACGSDSSGPSGPPSSSSPVGSYSITTINGKALPVALFAEAAYTYEVTNGTMALTSDGKYVAVTNYRQTIPGNISLFIDSTYGTWTQSGAQVRFRNALDTAAKDTATWAGNQLSFALTDGKVTTTYLYTKK